jgi:hypothetical protein
MLKRKISISDAYSVGFRNILDNYAYFLVATVAGILVTGVFLVAIGYFDSWDMIAKHFAELSKFFHESMRDAGGALSHSKHSHEVYAQKWAPAQLTQFFSNLKQVHLHIDKQEIMNFWHKMVPAAIVFKLVLDLLGVGYIKMALDTKSKKPAGFCHFYSHYALVPKYFIVNLLVHLATVAGFVVVNLFAGEFSLISVLFLVPGIFVYQRLRLAKFFVIDKNHSIDQALKASWDATGDCWGNLAAFSVVEMIVNALGHMLILTSFFVFPLSFQVEANVYRQLVK